MVNFAIMNKNSTSISESVVHAVGSRQEKTGELHFLKVHDVRDGFNAEGKAPADVERILLQLGFAPVDLFLPRWDDPLGLCARVRYHALAGRLLRKYRLFVQYPFYAPHPQALARELLHVGCRITVLVHDLDMLRGGREESESLLRCAETLIVHTEAMKKFLVQKGFEAGKIRVLQCFDYLVTFGPTRHAQLGHGRRIAFAGNLEKSEFLKLLHRDVNLSSLHFLLYGSVLPAGVSGKNVEYKGCFNPDDLRPLAGDWGLVWDGESLNTCCGSHGLGEYLRYNASHKFSLYLAAGMPVIVWKDSGVAKFVEEHHLGFCVETLDEIPRRLDALTDDELNTLGLAVADMSCKLRRGENLRRCLK